MQRLPMKFAVLALMAGAIAVAPRIAKAEYPDHQITIVVGTGAGGAADVGARLVGKALEKILGQPIVVINKVGGGGTKALELLRKEKPDGYTLVYAFSHHITFGGQYRHKVPLFTAKDFDYVGSLTEPRQSLVSLTGRGWTTFKGMVKSIEASHKPIRLVYSGGPGRLVGVALQKGLHYPVKVIRVRGGAKSMAMVLGGHVDIAFSGGAHAKYTAAGKTEVLATVSEDRNPDFPKAPTLKELGIPASTTTLQLLVAPKGLPPNEKKKLTDAVAKVAAEPKIVQFFHKNLSMRMKHLQGKALMDYMVAEQDRFTKLIARYSK